MDPAAAGFVSCFLTVYILPLLSCIVNTFLQLFSGNFSRVFQIISVIVYYTRFYQIVIFWQGQHDYVNHGSREGRGTPGEVGRVDFGPDYPPPQLLNKKGKIPS